MRLVLWWPVCLAVCCQECPISRKGCVLVTINYRLGVLGLLKVEGGDYNVAIWDQVGGERRAGGGAQSLIAGQGGASSLSRLAVHESASLPLTSFHPSSVCR